MILAQNPVLHPEEKMTEIVVRSKVKKHAEEKGKRRLLAKKNGSDVDSPKAPGSAHDLLQAEGEKRDILTDDMLQFAQELKQIHYRTRDHLKKDDSVPPKSALPL